MKLCIFYKIYFVKYAMSLIGPTYLCIHRCLMSPGFRILLNIVIDLSILASTPLYFLPPMFTILRQYARTCISSSTYHCMAIGLLFLLLIFVTLVLFLLTHNPDIGAVILISLGFCCTCFYCGNKEPISSSYSTLHICLFLS